MSDVETVQLGDDGGIQVVQIGTTGEVVSVELIGAPVSSATTHPFVDWFSGEGSPPPVVPGAGPGDMWIDTATGALYQLR